VEDDITGLTYEAALAELDTLITKLEGGSIALEEAIGAFERGTLLAQHCAALLERTEQRVNQLVVGADGGIGERPLEAAGAPAAARPAPVASARRADGAIADRSRRRSFLTARIHRIVVNMGAMTAVSEVRRVDLELVARRLAPSRQRAQALVAAGLVEAGRRPSDQRRSAGR